MFLIKGNPEPPPRKNVELSLKFNEYTKCIELGADFEGPETNFQSVLLEIHQESGTVTLLPYVASELGFKLDHTGAILTETA